MANASHGLPDLGLTELKHVLEDTRRIVAVTSVPLLVDADTGWGDHEMISEAASRLSEVGAAGLHLEDQIDTKRCGHRPGKRLVSTVQMQRRIETAVKARIDQEFVIMARTDAVMVEGLDAAINRARHYLEAGAEMIFAEALTNSDDFRRFTDALEAPVLANMTEFGRTPLLTLEQLRALGVDIALYPLSAFRAMNHVAANVYDTIRRDGTQRALLDQMQTRDQLYEVLDYYASEQKIDQILQRETGHDQR